MAVIYVNTLPELSSLLGTPFIIEEDSGVIFFGNIFFLTRMEIMGFSIRAKLQEKGVTVSSPTVEVATSINIKQVVIKTVIQEEVVNVTNLLESTIVKVNRR
jgi:hypothetical protein